MAGNIQENIYHLYFNKIYLTKLLKNGTIFLKVDLMKRLFKIAITCIVCLSIIGLSFSGNSQVQASESKKLILTQGKGKYNYKTSIVNSLLNKDSQNQQ